MVSGAPEEGGLKGRKGFFGMGLFRKKTLDPIEDDNANTTEEKPRSNQIIAKPYMVSKSTRKNVHTLGASDATSKNATTAKESSKPKENAILAEKEAKESAKEVKKKKSLKDIAAEKYAALPEKEKRPLSIDAGAVIATPIVSHLVATSPPAVFEPKTKLLASESFQPTPTAAPTSIPLAPVQKEEPAPTPAPAPAPEVEEELQQNSQTVVDFIEQEKLKAKARLEERRLKKEQELLRIAQHRRAIQEMEKLKAENDKKGSSGPTVPLMYRPFFSADSSRAEGRWASSTKILVKGSNSDNKVSEVHFVVLFYNAIMGALGGIVTGLETGYFSINRLPAPNVPIPAAIFPSTVRSIQYGLAGSSVTWRFAKRVAVSGLMYDILERNFETARGVRDWKNSMLSGATCGAIFGLRGGARSAFTGFFGFGAFGALAGTFSHWDAPQPDN